MLLKHFIYAPNINSGGGWILLRGVLKSLPAHQTLICFLDARIRESIYELDINVKVVWVEPSISSRLKAEFKLRQLSAQGDQILIFNGIPPIIRNSASWSIFLQNRLLISDVKNFEYSWKVFARLSIEKLALYFARNKIKNFFVQSQTMSKTLFSWLKRHNVERPEELITIFPFSAALTETVSNNRLDLSRFDFCYVADGAAHKNHRNLIKAFELLAEDGIFPSLALTLGARDAKLISEINNLAVKGDLKIKNLGVIQPHQVHDLYKRTKALVFPSLIESFGLPLVEAAQNEIPIICTESDFARDVCVPHETFDAQSPRSIARALRRFLGTPEELRLIHTPDEFINLFLTSADAQVDRPIQQDRT